MLSEPLRTADATLRPATSKNASAGVPAGVPGPRSPPIPPGNRITPSPRRPVEEIRRRRPQQWINSYRRNLIRTDLVVVIAMVFASQTIRLDGNATVAVRGTHGFSYYLLSTALILLWVTALGINGVWDQKMLGAGPSEYRRIMQASFYLFGFIAILSYLARADVARGYLAMALPLGLFGLLGGRWVWRQLLHEHRRAGSHMNTVLVIGDLASATALATRLKQSPNSGYRVSGLCVPRRPAPQRETEQPGRFVVMGHLDNVTQAIERSSADTVAVSASEHFGSEQVRQLAWQLEGTGVGLILAPALTDVAGPRIHIKPVAGLPLMHVQEPQFRGPKLVLKTALDLAVAGTALVLLSPVLAVVAILIKLSDRGPAILPTRARRPGGPDVHGLEVPVHADRRRPADRRGQSSVRTGRVGVLQVFFGLADHRYRPRHPVDQHRRATAAVQRAVRADEHRRPATVGAGRGCGDRKLPGKADAGSPRDHRAVAGVRAVGRWIRRSGSGWISTTSRTGPWLGI